MKLKKFKNWNKFYSQNKGNRYPDNFIIIMLLSEFKNLSFGEKNKINILDLGMGGGGKFVFFTQRKF